MADVCFAGLGRHGSAREPPLRCPEAVFSKAFPCAEDDIRVALSKPLRRRGLNAGTQ